MMGLSRQGSCNGDLGMVLLVCGGVLGHAADQGGRVVSCMGLGLQQPRLTLGGGRLL